MNTKNIDLLPKFESSFSQKNWDELSTLVNPKLFRTPESKYDLNNVKYYEHSSRIMILTVSRISGT